tara:strand:- start:350 stop:991 length:642 start_codon:yes stop_codon:yes gene_type:complete
MNKKRFLQTLSLIATIAVVFVAYLPLNSCSTTPPPNDPLNICAIFQQYPEWYWDTAATRKKWGVPISIQMAIIAQESSFRADVRPSRTKLLWVIPWKRPSTAYGYSQALKGTWERYQATTGNTSVRSDFAAASDFIGWYANQAHQKARINKHNAYSLYLAYYEGIENYRNPHHHAAGWILQRSRHVQARANLYYKQLIRCEGNLRKKPWYRKL